MRITEDQLNQALSKAHIAVHTVISLNPRFKWTERMSKEYESQDEYICKHCGLYASTNIKRHERNCKPTDYICQYCGGYCNDRWSKTVHERNCGLR
jgi:predicted SprT family Zn-dependent metalloprotease